MDRFLKPNFLETEVPEEDSTFEEGSCVSVRFLKRLPKELAEHVPGLKECQDGYVLKQYNKADPNFSKHDLILFENEPELLSSKDFESFSLSDKARILKKRQEEVRRYFGEDLKDTVVQSSFFVSEAVSGEGSVYEVQERLLVYKTLAQMDEIDFSQFDGEARSRLKTEALKLSEVFFKLFNEFKTQTDPVFKTFIPDLNANNIAITKDGHIRIFDTNFWGFQWSGLIPNKVESAARLLKNLAQKL